MTRLSRRLTLSGSGVINATAAEIAAIAAASGLIPGAIYFDAATGVHYLASSTSAYAPLSTAVHLGTITTGAMLAYSSPTEGMTCYLSGFQIPPKMRHNGTYWAPDGGRQQIAMLLDEQYEGTEDGTERLVPGCQVVLPAGLLAYTGAGVEVEVASEKTDAAGASAGTTEYPSLTVRMGSAGTTADAAIGGPWTGASGRSIGQTLALVRRTATTVRLLGAGPADLVNYARMGTFQNQARAAAVTVGDMDAGDNYVSVSSQRASTYGLRQTVNTFNVYIIGR